MVAAKPLSVLLSAAFALLLGAAAFAQTARNSSEVETVGWKAAERPFTDLAENAGTLQSAMAATNDTAANLLASIRVSTQFLRDRWTHSLEHQPVPKSYLESLQLDADILKNLPARKLSDHNANAILRDVADDLAIKAAHCKASIKGWASVIAISINTLKQGNPVTGLEVWYVPKGWADVPERWMRCSKLSSPALAGLLPPGNYMLRIAAGEPVPVRVGGDGKDMQSIDLLVP
jgi:hypothetical protein